MVSEAHTQRNETGTELKAEKLAHPGKCLIKRDSIGVHVGLYTILDICVASTDVFWSEEYGFDETWEHLVELYGAIIVQGVEDRVVQVVEGLDLARTFRSIPQL